MLEINQVSLRFGGTVALSEVSMDVEDGMILGILGPNGAGKTSLLNCVSGFYTPGTGSIRFKGVDLAGMPPHKRAKAGIGRTFQNIELLPEATVEQNVLLGRHMHMRSGVLGQGFALPWARREEREHRALIAELLEFFQVSQLADSHVSELAYGQQKLVELARSVAGEPSLVLLDEPMSGMSQAEKEAAGEVILRMRDERGLTLMVIEHDTGFLAGISDQMVAMDYGGVIARGQPSAVMADASVAAAYLGTGSTLSALEERLAET